MSRRYPASVSLTDLGTDAVEWVKQWRLIYDVVKDDDDLDGWMLGWFANAIEAGRSAGRKSQFDPVRDIENFHEKFELAYHGLPRALPLNLGEFRHKFAQEELDEYKHQMSPLSDAIIVGSSDVVPLLEEQLDALVDLVYVALGTSYLHGFNFREAWRRVHNANMMKVRARTASESKRGSTYDVVKPPGWVAPSHRDLVEQNAHNSHSSNWRNEVFAAVEAELGPRPNNDKEELIRRRPI